MPSSSSNHKQQGTTTTNQPVVQAIVDSLTRCFSPIVGSDEYGTGRCPSTTNTTVTANNTRRRDGTSSSKSRRSSSTSTTTTDQHKPNNNNNNNKGTYDADRYIHRKLEIFRTTDEECLAEFGIPHPRPTKRHKSSSPNSKKEKEGKEEKGGNNHRRNQSANTLVYSSEDQSEEIDNITTVQLREKYRQQAANNSNNPSSTSNNNTSGGNNLANILNILRNPFNCLNELHELQTKNGLCFANPIHENGSFEYDWKLTDEELKKFKEDGMIPDVDESSASLDGGDDEEQTMTSASYFDQKYSHIKITNPPMLLYTEHRVKYEEYDDHIFQIVERRKRGYNVHTSTAATSSNGGRRGSPTTSHIVLKKNSKLLESKFKARRDKKKNAGINKGGNKRNDENVVPLAKSSSVSADSVTDPALAAAVC